MDFSGSDAALAVAAAFEGFLAVAAALPPDTFALPTVDGSDDVSLLGSGPLVVIDLLTRLPLRLFPVAPLRLEATFDPASLITLFLTVDVVPGLFEPLTVLASAGCDFLSLAFDAAGLAGDLRVVFALDVAATLVRLAEVCVF